jgi:hypothetical protein
MKVYLVIQHNEDKTQHRLGKNTEFIFENNIINVRIKNMYFEINTYNKLKFIVHKFYII